MRAPMIFGRARSTPSLIRIGSVAERIPLPVVMTVEHGDAARLDAPDFGKRFYERVSVPGVARHDPLVERLAHAHRVGGEQERSAALEPRQRADDTGRV